MQHANHDGWEDRARGLYSLNYQSVNVLGRFAKPTRINIGKLDKTIIELDGVFSHEKREPIRPF